jgi:nucleoside-diphosphate-sugar epimerase
MLNKVKDFYAGQKVVVIGGAGFVGVQLVRLLVESGADVIVADDFSRGKNIVSGARYLFGDQFSYWGYKLESADRAKENIYKFNIDGFNIADKGNSPYLEFLFGGSFAVFNLAAVVAGVLHNENHHNQMYDDNIRVLASPLRASEQAGVPHYLQTSSVCVYAEDHQSPCDESRGWGGDPHPANAGYAEAKRDGERMVQWLNLEHAVIVRPSNIIGPYDYYDDKAHVVPAFVKRAIETDDDKFRAYGSATTQREFIHSADVAEGMMFALAMGKNKEAYNLGCNGSNTITMLSLAHRILQLVDSDRNGERHVVFNNAKGGGDQRRFSNTMKMQELGWKHKYSLNTALAMTVSEYVSRIHGYERIRYGVSA